MAKKKHWIAGAIKRPGIEKKAAKKAGMSTHAYMEEHKNSPSKAGSRARLGLRLSAMSKKKSGGVASGSKTHRRLDKRARGGKASGGKISEDDSPYNPKNMIAYDQKEKAERAGFRGVGASPYNRGGIAAGNNPVDMKRGGKDR